MTLISFVEKLGNDIKSLGADKAYKSKEIDRLLDQKKQREDGLCEKYKTTSTW